MQDITKFSLPLFILYIERVVSNIRDGYEAVRYSVVLDLQSQANVPFSYYQGRGHCGNNIYIFQSFFVSVLNFNSISYLVIASCRLL